MTYLLTVKPDSCLASFFEHMRQQHYPVALNRVPAHIMAFHQLPEEHLLQVRRDCTDIANTTGCLKVVVEGIRFLGRGNAYHLVFDHDFYHRLKKRWHTFLIAQDQHRWQPHMTFQNKVSPADAKALYHQTQSLFAPRHGTLIGLTLWHYDAGYWQHVNDFYFKTTVDN